MNILSVVTSNQKQATTGHVGFISVWKQKQPSSSVQQTSRLKTPNTISTTNKPSTSADFLVTLKSCNTSMMKILIIRKLWMLICVQIIPKFQKKLKMKL